jgi:hypothetical protein
MQGKDYLIGVVEYPYPFMLSTVGGSTEAMFKPAVRSHPTPDLSATRREDEKTVPGSLLYELLRVENPFSPSKATVPQV